MIRDYGKKVPLYVNGQRVEAQEGEPLVEVLNRVGQDIAHVCYHPALGPIQTCDTCVVDVNGSLERSCAMVVSEGLRVNTETSTAQAVRVEGMQRILGNHELYCTICDYNNGDCTVHNATALLQIEHQKYEFEPKPYELDDSNPFYQYDPDQCILCGRCVQACQNVQVTETLSIDWDAEHPRVLWDGGSAIDDSSCVSCGHCITVCPCNALMEKSMVGEAGHFTGKDVPQSVRRPAIELVKSFEPYTGYNPIFALSDAEAAMREADIKKTKTVCTYCGVGCSFDIWTKGRQILKVDPQFEAPANSISTCIKGKFGWDYTNSDERITTPLIRDGDRFREASWDEALDLIAEKLGSIKEQHGPHSIGVIGSSKCTNEESYLTQKFARAIIGTNNVDNCSRYCQSPATVGLWRTVGYGGDAGSIKDIEKAALVLIVGSNTDESHPVLATRIKSSQKLRGQKVIVSDLRKHIMAERADIFLQPKPGTDLVWLSAVTKYILDNDMAPKQFLEEWVNDVDKYKESLAPFTLEFAERVSGISQATLVEVAEEVAKADSVCGLWAMGVTQHTGGSDTSTAISNLLVATGNYGRTGTGGYPLRGHNNVQGASDFGSITTFYTGYQEVKDPEIRAKFEKGWGVELPEEPGLNNYGMIDEIHEGNLKAMYVIGEDLGIVDANANHVQDALSQLDFFVVQDLFMSRTAEFADVVLPASPILEKEGTVVNTERRIQRLYQALEPLGDSRPDWEVLVDLAKRMGQDWGYTHPSQVMDEIASLTPLFAGVSYERLEGYRSLQWPVAADGTDTPLLYTERFEFDDGKARLFPLEWIEPANQPNEEYDLHLNNGRMLEHFHAGNMTYASSGIKEKVPSTFVEVGPQLAEERGVETGDWVRLISPRGSVRVQALVSDRVHGNELYMPMNSRTEPVNLLTSSDKDRVSDTPAYKELAVKMEKLGESGESPLPSSNPRFGNPTPQYGVQVERKWDRDDYVYPTQNRPEGGNI